MPQVQIAARANDILVRTPRVTIYSRLVEGRFPRWRDVFPQRHDVRKIELPVGPLHSAVRQAAIVTSDESRGVDFTFAEGMLVLAGQAAEVGQSRVELPIGYNGPEIADHARSALRERFSQSARSGKDIHVRAERCGKRRGLHDRRRLRLRDHAAGPRSVSFARSDAGVTSRSRQLIER